MSGSGSERITPALLHAATSDRRSRILDDKDDREPLFYTRHVVVDFEPEAI